MKVFCALTLALTLVLTLALSLALTLALTLALNRDIRVRRRRLNLKAKPKTKFKNLSFYSAGILRERGPVVDAADTGAAPALPLC